MDFVATIEELKNNFAVIDNYLEREIEPQHGYAISLIKKGTCFVAKKAGSGYKFYPSRFIGYINNSMEKHESNDNKDGRETNPAITDVIGSKPVADTKLDWEYRVYCKNLGFDANAKGSFGVERKFWILND